MPYLVVKIPYEVAHSSLGAVEFLCVKMVMNEMVNTVSYLEVQS